MTAPSAPNAEPTVEPINVSGRPLLFRPTTMPVSRLRLDPANPRLRDLALRAEAEGKPLTEAEIEKHLWENPDVKRLFNSIVASAGLSEPLWVYEDGRVPEGNERLVCLRKIARDLKGDGRRKFTEANVPRMEELVAKVPVKIVPNDVTDADMDILLARLHVTGKDEWPTFNQAAHVYKLNHDDGISVERIAELLAVSTSWVYMRLKAYEWTKGFLDASGTRDLSVYSKFEEAYKVKAKLRKNGLDLDKEEDMESFRKMISSGHLAWAIDIRKLPKMLEREETRKLVLDGKLKEAQEKLPELDPSEASPRLAAIVKAKEALGKLDRDDLRLLKENKPYQLLLTDLAKELTNVVQQALRV